MRSLLIIALCLLCQPAQATENLSGDYSINLKEYPKWSRLITKVKIPKSKGTVTGDEAYQTMQDIHYGWYTHGYSYIGYDPKDHWKTPAEFNKDKGGDCEDFAIANYFAGVRAGIPEDAMEVVIGLYQPTGEYHAALRLDIGGGTRFYFQGITTRPIPEKEYLRTFVPYYGINRHHVEINEDEK